MQATAENAFYSSGGLPSRVRPAEQDEMLKVLRSYGIDVHSIKPLSLRFLGAYTAQNGL